MVEVTKDQIRRLRRKTFLFVNIHPKRIKGKKECVFRRMICTRKRAPKNVMITENLW